MPACTTILLTLLKGFCKAQAKILRILRPLPSLQALVHHFRNCHLRQAPLTMRSRSSTSLLILVVSLLLKMRKKRKPLPPILYHHHPRTLAHSPTRMLISHTRAHHPPTKPRSRSPGKATTSISFIWEHSRR